MPEARYVDLHLHSYYSDGTFSPLELMQHAKDEGISCIAITDHDTVQALPFAFAQKPEGLEVIPGIELSCDWKDREAHILGYFIDYKDDKLLEKLEGIRKQRVTRMHLMVDKLREMNVDIIADEVFSLAGLGTVGRLHLARVLLAKKIIFNINEAFIRFIGEDCPAYVSQFRLSVQGAINTILDSGGVPVLAHPYTTGDDDFIETLTGFGLKGIEVYYPEHSSKQVEHYKMLAQRLDLISTGGSDCHGYIKEKIKVGSLRLPYKLVEELKKIKDEIQA